MTRRYPEATTWLCDQIEDVVKDGKLDFPESTFEQMVIAYQVGVDSVYGVCGYYYIISENTARDLVDLSRKSPAYFDEIARICAVNIQKGKPMPEALKIFASLVLHGVLERPKTRHRPRKKNWMEMAFLYSLGIQARDNFDLKLTRNDATGHKLSACDALAEALNICGRKTRYSEIKRIFVHKDFARFREENARIAEAWRNKESFKRMAAAFLNADQPKGPLSLLASYAGVEKE